MYIRLYLNADECSGLEGLAESLSITPEKLALEIFRLGVIKMDLDESALRSHTFKQAFKGQLNGLVQAFSSLGKPICHHTFIKRKINKRIHLICTKCEFDTLSHRLLKTESIVR